MSENSQAISPESEMTVDDRQVQVQAAKVNQLLRELETKLDNNQHAVVTELLAERAVLGAMRVRRELEDLQQQRTAGSDKTAEVQVPINAFNEPVAPEKISAEGEV